MFENFVSNMVFGIRQGQDLQYHLLCFTVKVVNVKSCEEKFNYFWGDCNYTPRVLKAVTAINTCRQMGWGASRVSYSQYNHLTVESNAVSPTELRSHTIKLHS